MEIITTFLKPKQFEEVISYIIDFFNERNIEKVIVWYGWGSKTEKEYIDINININDLNDFISESERKNIFNLGKSDLYIFDPEKEYEFLLCHESDVHFKSNDKGLVQKVRMDWKTSKYQPYESKDKNMELEK